MKHFFKKLAALGLAGAMILSLGVTALAADPPSETTDLTSTDSVGQATGTGGVESLSLAKPVKVILPTLTAATQSTMFNMILDPHGLIESTEAAKYAGKTFDFGGGTGVKDVVTGQDSDGNDVIAEQSYPVPKNYLFFADGDKYGPTSQILTIINKSDKAVSVALDLEAKNTKGYMEYADSVADAQSTKGVASMYLALGTGDDIQRAAKIEGKAEYKVDVTNVAATSTVVERGKATFTPEEPTEPTALADNATDAQKAQYAENLALYEATVKAVSALRSAMSGAGLTVTISSAYANSAASPFEIATSGTITGYKVATPKRADLAAEKTTLTLSIVTDDDAEIKVAQLKLNPIVAADATNTSKSTSINVKYGVMQVQDKSVAADTNKVLKGVSFEMKDQGDADTTLAKGKALAEEFLKETNGKLSIGATYDYTNQLIKLNAAPAFTETTFTFVLKEDQTPATKVESTTLHYDVKQNTTVIGTLTLTFATASSLSAETADVTETAAFQVVYDSATVAKASIKGNLEDPGLYADKYESNAYSRKLLTKKADGSDITDDDFPKAKFYLTGNINSDDAWDNNATAVADAVGAGMTVKLIWTIQDENSAYTDSFSDGLPSGPSIKPSVKVQTAAETNTPTAVTLVIDLGSGAKGAKSVVGLRNGNATLDLNKNSDGSYSTDLTKAQSNLSTGWTVVFEMAKDADAAEDDEAPTTSVSVDIFTQHSDYAS